MKKLLETLKKQDFQDWICLVFYPMVLLYRLPKAWIRSLWYARILITGKWNRYMGFNPKNALNSFFYRTQWFNINKYGWSGVSSVIGLGNYPISRWFHLSTLSSCLYANAGATTTLLGTMVWVFSHLIWLNDEINLFWVLSIIITLFFSSTAYAMAFTQQNYNILGWMFLPLALFLVLNQYYALAAVVWFAASLASITVIFLSLPLMSCFALSTGDYEVLWLMLPAVIKIFFHFLPILNSSGFRTVINIAKLIGFTQREVRYKRHSMKWTIFNLYFTALYFTVCLLLWWLTDQLPLLPVVALSLFVVNQLFLRVADEPSMIMLFISTLVVQILLAPPGIIEWVIFWLAVSPIPVFLGLAKNKEKKSNVTSIDCHPPFDHSEIEAGFEGFFSKVKSGSQILFAFKDPGNIYEQIFDGYRFTIEVPLYVAAKKGIHLFPDWYTVGDTNYHGARNCWGNKLSDVIELIKDWNIDYIVIYRDQDEIINSDWALYFDVIESFNWAQYAEALRAEPLWGSDRGAPVFYLLRLKNIIRKKMLISKKI